MSHSDKLKSLLFLNALMIIGMSTSIFTGQVKLEIDLWGNTIVFPASSLFFSFLTFPVTDIITNTFGPKEANRTVCLGFWSQFLTVCIIKVCLMISPENSPLTPFGAGGLLVFFASSIAYFTSQFWDVWMFDWIKRRVTGEKHLWIRNNVSTITSQFINSIIFISIVFGSDALAIMLPSTIILKVLLATIDTPFVYIGCYVLKKMNLERLQA
ncbi:MAG: putative integral membrane protein (TIGR00697 family) [Chlamydiales bacterium]|jgi:uncharacterized integral membrane protein (TIGR00697 family)